MICANSEDAQELRRENRNVVASAAIQNAMDQIGREPSALEKIDRSFELLFEDEKHGRYSIIRPDKMARTVYVFIKAGRKARRTLAEKDIRVMWGSEYGLSDDYLRLETVEPSYTGIFVDAINS